MTKASTMLVHQATKNCQTPSTWTSWTLLSASSNLSLKCLRTFHCRILRTLWLIETWKMPALLSFQMISKKSWTWTLKASLLSHSWKARGVLALPWTFPARYKETSRTSKSSMAILTASLSAHLLTQITVRQLQLCKAVKSSLPSKVSSPKRRSQKSQRKKSSCQRIRSKFSTFQIINPRHHSRNQMGWKLQKQAYRRTISWRWTTRSMSVILWRAQICGSRRTAL